MGFGRDEHYKGVSHTFQAVTVTKFLFPPNGTATDTAVDGVIQAKSFICYDDFLGTNESWLTVETGDVVGACIFNPKNGHTFSRRELDIVGEAEGHSLLADDRFECTTETLPSVIHTNRLSIKKSRRLHLYATVGMS